MLMNLDLDGKRHIVEAQIMGTTLWVHHQGETFTIELSEKSRRGKKSAKASSGSITSPMPGKVTKLFVSLGQKVKVGDSILVMEAMKMEYTLKSEVAGTVGEINCKTGEQVPLGQLLVLIKEEKAES